MGTEVLRPQDFLYDRFRLSPPAFYRRKSYFPNGNGFGNSRPNNSGYRKPTLPRPEGSKQKRKNSPPPPQRLSSPPPQPELPHQIPRRSSSADELQTNLNKSGSQIQNNLPPQMGSVTILRRGQSLDTIDASRMKRDLNNKARGGLMKKYMDEDDVYAGSAFFVSPSPSSLPLPSFFNTNNNITMKKDDEFQDSATRDLRRLLRLD